MRNVQGIWKVAAGIALAAGLTFSARSEPLEIALPEKALTFARSYTGGMPENLLLITRYGDGTVSGIDVSQALGRPVFDPVILYNKLGRQAILDALQVIPESAHVTVPVSELGMPVGLGGNHIAAGANFRVHADEADVEDGPFLFPKRVQPTPWNAPISVDKALLDYEAELCFVPLHDFPPVRPSRVFGLILCNDVTDRAKLLRHVDAANIASGEGFTTGKSAPGYLPVGNLFVIPADTYDFMQDVVLRLFVNDTLRQEAPVTRMVWGLDDILREAEGRKIRRWQDRGREVGLPFRKGRVPARAMILSGTPSGTVFEGVRPMHKVRGFLDYLFGGWNRRMQDWAVDRYVREERNLGRYLKPGDMVRVRVAKMGELMNPVVE